MWPRSPNIAPQVAPDDPLNLQKPSKSDGGSFVFALSLIFGKIAPEIPKMLQTVAQNGAKLGILVAKLANIAPSWRHPGRSWCQDGSQEASKWSSRGSPDHILRPEGPRAAPRPPLGSNFHEFSFVLGSIFIRSGVDLGIAWEGCWKIFVSFLALSVPC